MVVCLLQAQEAPKKILVLLRADNPKDSYRNKWELPGGWHAYNHSAWQKAVWEVRHATGLQFFASQFDGCGSCYVDERAEQFLCRAMRIVLPFRPEVVLGATHTDYAWLTLPAICTLDMIKYQAQYVQYLYRI